ncbi:MAG: cadherin-like domain-containing protein, partial [Ramlibacter sp.]
YDTALAGAASLQYSTFVGGSLNANGSTSATLTDSPTGVAISGGYVAISGTTDTSNFPTTPDAYSRSGSGTTGFLLVLKPKGGGASDLAYGTYYGAGLTTSGVAWGSGNRLYMVGSGSVGGLATADGDQPTIGGGTDALVALFSGFANSAPVLSGTADLPPQAEDAAPGPGTLVSTLVGGRITDDDAGALRGIAVTALDASNGSWQFTADGTTWSALPAPASGSALLLAADATTRVRFLPNANYAGTASITFRAWDRTSGSAGSVVAAGTVGDSSPFSASVATASVTVTPVNDAPTPGADVVAGTEDVPLVIAPATLLANDTDVDGDALTLTAVDNGSGGTVALSGGNIVFTPNPNFYGLARFSYTVADGTGAWATGTVQVNVAPVNDAPVANDDSATALTSLPLTIATSALLANDVDIEGDTLTVTGVGSAVHGTVSLGANSVTFTPDLLYLGPASFTYTISDGRGGTATATVDINVNAVLGNTAPTANGDAATATEDTPLAIGAATLLANDSDPDLLDSKSIIGVDAVQGGTVSLSGSTITFTPDADFAGIARFTYTIADSQGDTAVGLVTVNVVAINDAPVARNDAVSGTEDQVLTIAPAALLGNDADVEGDPLTITAVNNAVGGTVALVNGSIVFTPAANVNGPASFRYTVSD